MLIRWIPKYQVHLRKMVVISNGHHIENDWYKFSMNKYSEGLRKSFHSSIRVRGSAILQITEHTHRNTYKINHLIPNIMVSNPNGIYQTL